MGSGGTTIVAGASGLLGSRFAAERADRGETVRRLVRRKPRADGEFYWNPPEGILDRRALEGVRCVVNLAGRNIAARWSMKVRQEIADSRIQSTRLLAEGLAAQRGRATLVNASAIGIYGDRGEEALDENSAPGEGFLAGVCQDWEEATGAAESAGARVVRLRLGPVLTPHGGALAKMLTPFRLGLGGRVGSGRQVMSWISYDDALAALHAAVDDERLTGALNLTAPNPVTNAAFTRALGRALRRPTPVPLPAFAVRLLFGQMGEEVLLAGARVLPRALEARGFPFRHPDIGSALSALL